MYAAERQQRIVTVARAAGRVEVLALADELDVSPETIRRDLTNLERSGALRRVHGGAIPVERLGFEPSVATRAERFVAEKERIAKASLALVPDEGTILLDSGTTTLALARLLPTDRELTVVTNSLPVVNALAGRPVDLIVIGGLFRGSEMSLVGHIAEAAIRELRADLVFVGMRGIDPIHGFTSDFLPEALTDRAILQIAPRRVVLADHTKFGRVCAVYLAPVTAAELIISDHRLNPSTVDALREKGLEVMLA